MIKRILSAASAIALCAGVALFGQSSSSSLKLIDSSSAEGAGAGIHSMKTLPSKSRSSKPFSAIAFGGGVSPLGVNMQMATNLNRHVNLRGTGNIFNYNISNFTTNGFTVGGKLNLTSASTAIDLYPFANHGFRISPGALLYNQNAASANFSVTPGQSFTLNNTTYYSSTTNPVTGLGVLGLHPQKTAFTATTGWGNMIPSRGGHWSFPVELGAAFTGAPTLNMNLTGVACDKTGVYCMNVGTDPTIQANLQAQVAKYQKDLNPLKTYPIVSFGLAYSFTTRHGR
jgi:hypothetical protein